MKILVLRGGALGDFIVTIPALRLLKERWPEAGIALVGNAVAARLGAEDGVLSEVYSQHEARWALLYGDAPLPASLLDWLGRFDLVLSFWPDPDGELRRRFPVREGQRYLAGKARPEVGPAAAHFCAALKPLGLSAADYRPGLHLPGRPAEVDPLQVSLHPGSSSLQRNWPIDRWIAVAKELRARGYRVLIVAGECDMAAAKQLEPYGEVLVQAPLTELARRLAGCCLYLGHDTGVSHLAAALGVPCLVLFGPTDPDIWAPQGPDVRILKEGPDLHSIPVSQLIDHLPSTP